MHGSQLPSHPGGGLAPIPLLSVATRRTWVGSAIGARCRQRAGLRYHLTCLRYDHTGLARGPTGGVDPAEEPAAEGEPAGAVTGLLTLT